MHQSIKPFTARITGEQIEDLRQRLARTRWPDRETCDGWEQGMPLAYTMDLASYWESGYDFGRLEGTLNRWSQFHTELDGLDIHFIHQRSPHEHALPLVITHGWPGSTLEFRNVLDPLVDPTAHGGNAEDAFHVVAPSLPGYGFSGKPRATGTSVEAIGRLWGKLMERLGYDRYVAQGGDWGSIVTHNMGLTETGHCAGIHVNMPIVAPDPETMGDLTEGEQRALEGMTYYREWDSGYSKQQSTRPQTLGYGLADSPVGQMAWILEKFYTWTDCERDGVRHPENAVNRDDLLDNVTLYWLTNSAASSARLYRESFSKLNRDPIHMPAGCSVFPREIFRCSRRWAEKRYTNLIYFNELDRGGHFAALEQPELFIRELRDCFRALR